MSGATYRAQPSVRSGHAAPRASLGIRDVMALVVGVVIGAGIFSVPSVVAANSGSATTLMMAWVLGGAISLAGALCYAELATSYPHSGGEYHFLKLAFGDKVAFLFAWARLTVIPTGSIALLGFVFGDYAAQVLPIAGGWSSGLYAALAVVVLTAINVVGLQSGRRTQNLLTLLQVGGVVAIVVAGLALPVPTEPLPAAANAGTSNWGLVLIFVMLAYGGWNEAAYISAEVVGATRNLPRALVLSIAAITGLYLLMNFAYLRVLGLADMGTSPAVAADMMGRVLGGRGAQVISAIVAVAALTSMNATVLMAARTTYAFGRAAPMFAALGRWNPRLESPVHALLVQGTISLALIGLGIATRRGFTTMVEYTAPVFWLFFLLTGVALFVLRARSAPRVRRPFSVPLYPLTPLVFCAMSAYLLYASVRHTGAGALVGLLVLGVGALVLLIGGERAVPAAGLQNAVESSTYDQGEP
ncbi:MAG: amino acid permease [Pseudomonadota bacterium]|nr:amino acid permease [Pseudomonadota bacterium]